MRNIICPILIFLVGIVLTLMVQRYLRCSNVTFPNKVGMMESEVTQRLGKPSKVNCIFSILPPDDWPESAEKHQGTKEPTSDWIYGNTGIDFNAGRVCDIRFIRWDRYKATPLMRAHYHMESISRA